MDRMRGYDRQRSNTGTPGAPSSPMMSPLNRHVRAGSIGTSNVRRAQNTAAKAAAQRLAQVMAHQSADEDDDEDDLAYDYNALSATGGIGLASGRAMQGRSPMSVRAPQKQTPSARSRSPMSVRAAQEQTPSARSGSPMSVRTAQEQTPSARSQSPVSLRTAQEQPPSAKAPSGGRSSSSASSVEQSPSARAPSGGAQTVMSVNYVEQPPSARSKAASRPLELSPSARTIIITRSPQPSNMNDQPPSARAAARPNAGGKAVSMVPPVPLSLRPTSSLIPSEVPMDIRKDKRLSLDMGSMNSRGSMNLHPATALEDELDMLQEENESLLEKLRLAEERCEEAESRARQLEQQVANLGEGTTLEARLLSRKEAALQQREAALRVAAQTHGGTTQDVAALRAEAEVARDEATSALERLHETENELNSLRFMTQRMILTPEEMEEIILKRCWLARYWELCVQHGIHAEIAGARSKYWSSFAPNPVEVLLVAGQKAKEETVDNDLEDAENPCDLKGFSGEGNIENMLFVEQGLRELASLKVEEALVLAMAQHRRPNSLKIGFSDDFKIPTEGHYDAFELSKEEAEDVSFKQAWLTYIWRRAKKHGIEPDIADERLQYWINQNSNPPTSHDAVDVERGLTELKKLGIETQLWEESRKEFEQDIGKPKLRSHSDSS